MDSVHNLADFGRVLVLDRRACNCDGRQAVFSRRGKRGYFATFIDQGYCFKRRGVEFSGFSLARGLCPKLRLPECNTLGRVRAGTQPGLADRH